PATARIVAAAPPTCCPTWKRGRRTKLSHGMSSSRRRACSSGRRSLRPASMEPAMVSGFEKNVLPLVAYRAARFLRGCLHAPPWLESIAVDLEDDAGPRVVVRVRSDDPMIPRCVPTRISVRPGQTGVPIRVVVVQPEGAGGD